MNILELWIYSQQKCDWVTWRKYVSWKNSIINNKPTWLNDEKLSKITNDNSILFYGVAPLSSKESTVREHVLSTSCDLNSTIIWIDWNCESTANQECDWVTWRKDVYWKNSIINNKRIWINDEKLEQDH